jgi:hypothetical protein
MLRTPKNLDYLTLALMTLIKFYFDEHISRSVEKGLTERGYQVVMAVDVGMESKDDDTDHLPYATEHQLVIVTCDRPFAGRTEKRTDHSGLICLSEKLRKDIGATIRILAQFAEKHTPDDTKGRVFWLK